MPEKAKVYMFVMNSCSHDARVLKEARTLTQAGYQVKIIAILDSSTEPYEVRDGFEIIRVIKDPVHYKIFRAARKGKTVARRFSKKIKKFARRFIARTRREARWWGRWWKQLVLHFVKAFIRFIPVPIRNKLRRTRVFHQPSVGKRNFVTAVAFLLFSPVKVTAYFIKGLQWCANGLWNIGYRALIFLFSPLHRPLSFLDYYLRAYRIVKASPGDIYHAHDLNTLPVAWWAKRKLGGKLVYDSHELYTETSTLGEIERWWAQVVESKLIKDCESTITVNESIAEELVKRYRIRKPVVIKNCPDMKLTVTNSDLIKKRLALAPEERVLLYQGGFSPNRGLENLLSALHYLPHGKLVFIGWGKLEASLRDQAEEAGLLNNRVFFIPSVPQKELLQWPASADVGVIPYRAVGLNNYYTLPNKLFEYIAAGIPVAASDFPELRKVVLGHELGSVFDPEDPKDIARAIEFILSDPGRYHRMKENARKAARIYNWENESKKLLKIYAELLRTNT